MDSADSEPSAAGSGDESAASARFVLTFVVPASDIDELGHASNIAYVRWLQDAAFAHSVAVGLDIDAYRRGGGVFVVRRQEIDYVRPVLRGDTLAVRTWIDTTMAAKSIRATEMVRQAPDGTEEIVLRARTTWGFVDLATGRPMRIPPFVRDAFGMPPR